MYNIMFYYPINLHYSQTGFHRIPIYTQFYYPINLHYSQTETINLHRLCCVLLPYKFTLLSNQALLQTQAQLFYYPINLHYSQTIWHCSTLEFLFYYPINLHYSQTYARNECVNNVFYYPINLHYSQTHCG